jgi:hypothetical protein
MDNSEKNIDLYRHVQIFLQRSEVQGAIYEGSQKIRFPVLLPPYNFT